MKLEPGDVKNKKYCAKVDKTMAELRSVSQEGSSISELSLQIGTETLNQRIRNMNLSGREIMFSRLQNVNENIKLNDKVLFDAQFENRSKANATAVKDKSACVDSASSEVIDLHSLVFLVVVRKSKKSQVPEK